MQSNKVRVLAGIAVVAVAAVLLIVLKDDGKSASEKSEGAAVATEGSHGGSAASGVPRIVIEGGRPVGGVKELTYAKGDRIRFEVRSDVSDEIHVHGYDLMKDVEAGGTIGFDFPATIEGIFEVELEGRKEQIAELRVNP